MTIVPSRARAGIPLRRSSLALCFAAVLALPPAIASTITVSNCDDSGAGSLRDAVTSAISGDTIGFDATLACSTITLTSGAITIATGADGLPLTALEIQGPGRNALAIDGNYIDRVIAHEAGVGGALTISGLALHHGFTSGDGGCVLAEGAVDLSDVELTECSAGIGGLGTIAVRGGALSVGDAASLSSSFVGDSTVNGGSGFAYGAGIFAGRSLSMDSSTVSGNFATSDTNATYGGGVSVGRRDMQMQGTLTVTLSDIQNNAAFSHCGYCPVRGGGAFVYGNTSMGASSISGNSAFSDAHYGAGGGLYFKSAFDAAPVGATLVYTNIGSNSADNDGGAIGASGDLQIIQATISGNSGLAGGAIVQLAGTLTLYDSLMTGNIAQTNGGAVWLHGYGDVTVKNSTISENLAQGNGGAIANSYGSVHLTNATVTGNSANGLGGGVWFEYPYYALGIESTIVAGNMAGGSANDIFAPGGTVEGSHDLIVAAPGLDVPIDTISDDPLLLPLADNGGVTMTHALAQSSPAIDAGDNPLGLPNDQRGEGFVRSYGDAPDIGAFEVQPAAPFDRIFADGFDPNASDIHDLLD
jgi:parallel beta helix pectate lyase-like protein